MKASIIICTYNRAQNLRTALQCLEWQTHKDFEVIVVAGPSTDSTSQVLSEYEDKIRILHCSEKNISMSRNIGASAAASNLLCFMDDDFEPSPQWLASFVKAYKENYNVGGIAGLSFNSDGETHFSAYTLSTRFCEGQEMLPGMYISNYCIEGADPFATLIGCNMAITKSALQKVGGFNEEIAFCYDEIEVSQRIIDSGYMIAYAKEAKGVHRVAHSEVRSEDYFHINPFHALKNYIYCIYLWNKGKVSEDVILDTARKKFEYYMEIGKQACQSDKISYEDFQLYKERAAKAFHLGVEIGKSMRRKEVQILNASEGDFKMFVRKRKQNSLKICILNWSAGGSSAGGTVVANNSLAQAMSQRGHEVHVITPRSSVKEYYFVDDIHYHCLGVDENYNLFNVPFQPGNAHQPFQVLTYDYFAYKKICEIYESGGVDVVMSMLFRSNLIFASQDKRWATVVSLCTTLKTWQKTTQFQKNCVNEINFELEKFPLGKATLLHAISNFILEDVKNSYGDVFDDKVSHCCIPVGIEDRFVRDSSTANNGIRIFYAGRLEERKSIHTLLSAAAIALGIHKQAELYLAGFIGVSPTGRTYKQDFDAQYRGTDIWNRVHFLGFVSDDELHRQYSLCDIYCMPSLSESFGVPYVEAAMHGKPSIGCRAGGIPEVIVDGETGLLAEPGDIYSLVECMKRLICDKKLRERMGKAARRRYEVNYTSSVYAERMEKEFLRIAGKDFDI